MNNFRLSRKLCAVVADSLSGSHDQLNGLFISSGAPGDPPDLAHHSKWKTWLFQAGEDPKVDSLRVLGNILEEFMDVEPDDVESQQSWAEKKAKIEGALAEAGLEYFQGGRVMPNGEAPDSRDQNADLTGSQNPADAIGPRSVDDLIGVIVRGIPKAMYPLSQRRKGATSLSFRSEYDVQDLLHAMLRPWVRDIRAEEFTPSYAGSSTRMDFLLPEHATVIETKIVRDSTHAKKVGDELIIDISHYAAHPKCDVLWCVIYDPENLLKNSGGLVSDLQGEHNPTSGSVMVKMVIV
ncbi:hypothetical protein [Hyphomonas sp.]|uniref:PD-(D/E)XK nuclease domain-containing protein n=1 Tax=Hyphomonas sp. TaxID=87 RepID=UPI000C409931|nr:hypothetical protein [Hyphomonas sp.]MAU68224.1 transposase [Hyphomonas sp.]MBM58822.1 transposase [Hyphomonas sp.]